MKSVRVCKNVINLENKLTNINYKFRGNIPFNSNIFMLYYRALWFIYHGRSEGDLSYRVICNLLIKQHNEKSIN